MTNTTNTVLDPAALSIFAASLTNLPQDEISKAKKLYILNAIADFQAARRAGKTMMITMGVLCIIPVFLVVFIPGLIAYRSGIAASKQKILNAIEVWKDDLGDDYRTIKNQVS